jgi:hypothetical protein
MRQIGLDIRRFKLGTLDDMGSQSASQLHARLDECLVAAPSASQAAERSEPMTGDAWFDLSYNVYLTDLYQPSPGRSHTPTQMLRDLRASAWRALSIYAELCERKMVLEVRL